MYIPEYSITPGILKNTAVFEYNRALIKSTPLMQTFEKKLEKEALIEMYHAELNMLGIGAKQDEVKRSLDNIPGNYEEELKGIKNAVKYMNESSKSLRLEEDDLINTHILLSEQIITEDKYPEQYREKDIEYRTYPEKIQEEITDLFYWFNSLDSVDMHPIITSGILKAQLEMIHPFNELNTLVADIITRSALLSRGYDEVRFLSIESYYLSSVKDYKEKLNGIVTEEYDLTSWLEYYAEGMMSRILRISDTVRIMGKDTKLAKVSGRVDLTQRQETIIEYLNDYGMLQNKEFPILFPGISEDSVLRDLKRLTEEGLVVKRGKTKSSRYELK